MEYISLITFLLFIIGFILVPTNQLPVSDATHVEESDQEIIWDYSTTDSNICLSDYCVQAARRISTSMDVTVDPCENFYQFTCGRYMQNIVLKNTSVIETYSILTEMKEIMVQNIIELLSTPPPSNETVEIKAITNARRLFNTCTYNRVSGTGDVYEILEFIDKEFGGWPTSTESIWDESKFNLFELLIKLTEYNIHPFFQVETRNTYDFLRLSKHFIEENNITNRTQFTKNSKIIVLKLSPLLKGKRIAANTENTDLFDFENQLIKCIKNASNEEMNTELDTTLRHISEKINVHFDFGEYIRRLYLAANVTLIDNDMIFVENLEILRKISMIIADQSYDTLQNYLMRRFFNHINFDISDITHAIDLYPVESISTVIDKVLQEKICVNLVTKKMGFAVLKLYIDKYFDEEIHAETTKMFTNIQETFIQMINQSTWIDTKSKKIAIEKAQSIMNNIGYPKDMYKNNLSELEKIYADFNFSTFHIQNKIRLAQLDGKEYFKQLHEPNMINEWSKSNPFILNAYYVKSFNKIQYPATYLQPPFFSQHAPKYLNYGASGVHMGHEIGHSFGQFGRYLDKNLNRYIKWWSKNNEKFIEQLNCIIEQYNEYTISQINKTVDGLSTIEENIADNYALQTAFKAYQKLINDENITEQSLPGLEQFTSEQLFFINAGYRECSKMNDAAIRDYINQDTHSLPEFRINGPTSNFDEFDRVFKCKLGQDNSRMNKCGVW